ncbi:DNA primase [Streptomyces kunmingensis]|uniref:DNA primase n=1 Tax=Streptomyces kunmingensis TaxID=68225 RepID=A0ABU6CC37_9ACTN|nr:DNA primase [Streptomyces kunmingensis]MEB3961606.1 DNA primase [Streptomyces kunmingensis]
MNRTAVGLAVGAGYVLGRTKKMKLAFAVGTMVAGKKLQLSPKAVLDMVRTQLDKNPQFQELGGQLRDDFRGVGKAATGAILERQMEGLASRLHSSTAGVRGRLEGVAPGADDEDDKDAGGSARDEDRDEGRGESRDGHRGESRDEGRDDDRPAPRKRAPAKKSASAGHRKAEQGARARGTTAKKTTSGAKKASATGAKKTAGTARRAPRSSTKGGQDNG